MAHTTTVIIDEINACSSIYSIIYFVFYIHIKYFNLKVLLGVTIAIEKTILDGNHLTF